ncbi:MAG: hypothetical protein A2Y17_11005 [Clostridiales bacterium GWF2_38_85]|nr:MAG: hypothetical protein A2Y17_11005 [Clostridiales bacterium GWF2_38_85]HBL84655.1 hypothetical protein [Clostridiales bacterium]
MDWLQKPKNNHHDFYRNQKLANFFIKLAAGKITEPNEYEKDMIAELIQKGYAFTANNTTSVTTPVFTRSEFGRLFSMLHPLFDEALDISSKIEAEAEKLLYNHVPSHLTEQVKSIACMRMFDVVIGGSAQIMYNKDYLKTNWTANEMPTVYAIIED